jgi:hypothetical protein
MMDALEQRVQALEQELQILKNQIQTMLLDIQEQVLSNTYPSLRSGEPMPQNPPASIRPQPEPDEPVRAFTPVRSVSFNDFNNDNDDESPALEAPPVKSKRRKSHHEDNPEDDHWQIMADLEDWAKKKIETIGPQKTAELIRAYAVKGRFTPEESDTLIDFVMLHVAAQPDAPTQPRRPAPFEATARPPQNARVQAASAPSAQPPTRPVQSPVPQPKPAKSKAARKRLANRQEQTVAAKPENPPEAEKQTVENESLVLRLIAGVQNAGAGIRWGRDDG